MQYVPAPIRSHTFGQSFNAASISRLQQVRLIVSYLKVIWRVIAQLRLVADSCLALTTVVTKGCHMLVDVVKLVCHPRYFCTHECTWGITGYPGHGENRLAALQRSMLGTMTPSEQRATKSCVEQPSEVPSRLISKAQQCTVKHQKEAVLNLRKCQRWPATCCCWSVGFAHSDEAS